MNSQSTYSLIGTETNGDCVLFMGNGTLLSTKNATITTIQNANVTVEKKQGIWYYTSDVSCKVTIEGKIFDLLASDYKAIK